MRNECLQRNHCTKRDPSQSELAIKGCLILRKDASNEVLICE